MKIIIKKTIIVGIMLVSSLSLSGCETVKTVGAVGFVVISCTVSGFIACDPS